MTIRSDRTDVLAALAARVGDDGTGDLGVIVDTASPDATVDDLVDIVLEAREEHRLNREQDK